MACIPVDGEGETGKSLGLTKATKSQAVAVIISGVHIQCSRMHIPCFNKSSSTSPDNSRFSELGMPHPGVI